MGLIQPLGLLLSRNSKLRVTETPLADKSTKVVETNDCEWGLYAHAWGITPAKEEELQKLFHMFPIQWVEKQQKQISKIYNFNSDLRSPAA